MAYRPNRPQETITADYIYGELLRISQEFQALVVPIITLALTYVEPDKPREGMVVHADGTEFNPGDGTGHNGQSGGNWGVGGGGRGVYVYTNDVWHKL